MKYRVPLRIEFDGYAVVEADDEVTAEDIACSIGATLDNVSDNGYDEIKHYEFDLHGYATRLDSESIEEFTDDDINELLKE